MYSTTYPVMGRSWVTLGDFHEMYTLQNIPAMFTSKGAGGSVVVIRS